MNLLLVNANLLKVIMEHNLCPNTPDRQATPGVMPQRPSKTASPDDNAFLLLEFDSHSAALKNDLTVNDDKQRSPDDSSGITDPNLSHSSSSNKLNSSMLSISTDISQLSSSVGPPSSSTKRATSSVDFTKSVDHDDDAPSLKTCRAEGVTSPHGGDSDKYHAYRDKQSPQYETTTPTPAFRFPSDPSPINQIAYTPQDMPDVNLSGFDFFLTPAVNRANPFPFFKYDSDDNDDTAIDSPQSASSSKSPAWSPSKGSAFVPRGNVSHPTDISRSSVSFSGIESDLNFFSSQEEGQYSNHGLKQFNDSTSVLDRTNTEDVSNSSVIVPIALTVPRGKKRKPQKETTASKGVNCITVEYTFGCICEGLYGLEYKLYCEYSERRVDLLKFHGMIVKCLMDTNAGQFLIHVKLAELVNNLNENSLTLQHRPYNLIAEQCRSEVDEYLKKVEELAKNNDLVEKTRNNINNLARIIIWSFYLYFVKVHGTDVLITRECFCKKFKCLFKSNFYTENEDSLELPIQPTNLPKIGDNDVATLHNFYHTCIAAKRLNIIKFKQVTWECGNLLNLGMERLTVGKNQRIAVGFATAIYQSVAASK